MTLPSDSFDSLSVSHEDALTVTQIPKVVAEGVWTKASMLITESNAITFAPGFGKRDRMVKSTSGPSPHLVIATKNSNTNVMINDQSINPYPSVYIELLQPSRMVSYTVHGLVRKNTIKTNGKHDSIGTRRNA